MLKYTVRNTERPNFQTTTTQRNGTQIQSEDVGFSSTDRFIAEHNVHVGHDLHERLLEELADEGRLQVQAEDLVVLRSVLGHLQNGLWRHSQEKALQGGETN